jgi:ATP phosphoribosyltransferase regulatory subunit
VRISAALPPGVTALLFEAAERRLRLEERLTAELAAAGYAEALLPVLDYHEPYAALTSAERRDRLYRFIGRDGEQLALRADFTPMLARLLAPRLGALPAPLRLSYRGDVVRHEEEPGGRWQEQYQLGAERIGGDGAEAEREALELFVRLVAAAAPEPPVRVVLGFAGALDRPLAAARARGLDPAALAAALERRERRAARAAGGALFEVVERGVPADPAALGEEAAGRLAAFLALRDRLAAGAPAIELSVDLAEFARNTLDPDLAAGADPDYYDGLVFRAYAGRAARAVGGGGRYDRLFRRLGADTAAAGFSLGLDRLLDGGPGR